MILLALICVAALAFAYAFVANERYFYYWDYRTYEDASRWLGYLAGTDPGSIPVSVARSMADDYNQLPAVPLVPFYLLLGPGRTTFILGLVAVYLIPFALAVGAVASRLVAVRGRLAFWSATTIAILLPPTWGPTLRGYPDIGGTALLALALFLLLGDPPLSRWRTILGVGLLTGCAIVFRRHLAYGAIAVLLVGTAAARVARLVRAGPPRASGRQVAAWALRCLTLGLVAIATTFVLAPSFAVRALSTDYGALYASYENSVGLVLAFFAHLFGWLVLGLALAGFAIGMANRTLLPRPTLTLLAAVAMFAALWLAMPRQIDGQYAGLIIVAVAPGIAGLLVGVRQVAVRAVVAVAVALNGAVGLSHLAAGLPATLASADQFRPAILSRPWPPLARADYATVADLARYLRQRAGGDKRVYVASSSYRLNDDILRGADQAVRGNSPVELQVLHASHIDSADRYPIHALLEADYVVVVTPFQVHIDPAEQDAVRTVVEQFADRNGLAPAYRRLPEVFTLDGGATATVFERIAPPTIAQVAEAARLMIEDFGRRPGSETNWVILNAPSGIQIETDRGVDRPTLRTSLAKGAALLLYVGPVDAASSLTAKLRTYGCAAFGRVVLDVAGVGRDGQLTPGESLVLAHEDVDGRDVALRADAQADLLLRLAVSEGASTDATCSIRLRDLAVTNDGRQRP